MKFVSVPFQLIYYVSFFPYRSSDQKCSVKKGVLRNFAKFTGKHLCQSLFFNKVAGASCNVIKKRLWHRCFPVNFAKFLRTPFSQNASGRLLLSLPEQIYIVAIWVSHSQCLLHMFAIVFIKFFILFIFFGNDNPFFVLF